MLVAALVVRAVVLLGAMKEPPAVRIADPEQLEILAFWHPSRGGNPPL